jgi:hypothetical protein
MYDQKSEVAHPPRQSSLDATAERGLRGLLAGRTKHAFITARLEQIRTTREQFTRVSLKWNRRCKKKIPRVQYNIDVVKRTRKLQVSDAV